MQILLLHSSKKLKADLQIFKTLPFTKTLFIKPYTNNIHLNYQKLMKTNDSNMFIHRFDGSLVIGRSHNNEIIDYLHFEVLKWEIDAKKYIIGAKHILLTNFENIRLRNLFVDLFGFKGDKICLDAIKYLFVIKYNNLFNEIVDNKDEDENNEDIVDIKDKDIRFTFNIETLLDKNKYLDCDLKLIKYWFCDSKIFKDAVRVVTEKKEKNVFTNEMGDKMGKIHIERQDLKEINIKKPKKIREKQ